MNSNNVFNQQVQADAASQSGSGKTGEIQIIPGENREVFFVVLEKGEDKLKEKLKELGGVYNAHMRGYRFYVRNMDKVLDGIKEFGATATRPVGLVDPRSVITVQFTQRFQWPGDMSVAEKALADCGLVKQTGRGNVWEAEGLGKVPAFQQKFGISQ